ncbi:MAG: hypothetical protein WCW26_02075 [Candidatus Buchananbacteria bacterium]
MPEFGYDLPIELTETEESEPEKAPLAKKQNGPESSFLYQLARRKEDTLRRFEWEMRKKQLPENPDKKSK